MNPAGKSFLLEENWSRLWASCLIDQLVKHGVQDFYCSPGMRNAPLLATLSHRSQQVGDVRFVMGMDERAHAYRALGAAKASGRPMALICTSGTAAANYLPAVIEAWYTSVPLILLTADRPSNVVLQQDNQTIRQDRLFQDVVSWQCSLPSPACAEDFSLMAQLVAKGMWHLQTSQRSIHLNIPLQEPLEAPADTSTSLVPQEVRDEARRLSTRLHHWQRPRPDHREMAQMLAQKIAAAHNPLIVLGELPLRWSADQQHQQVLSESLLHLLQQQQVTFFADAGSSCKYQLPLSARALPCPDHPEALELWKSMPFDLLVHLGGRTISKNYYQFLKQLPTTTELRHYHYRPEIEDPSGRFDARAHIDVEALISELIAALKQLPAKQQAKTIADTKLPLWEQLETSKRAIIDAAPISYPQVSKTLVESLPDHCVLFLGNSTVPRTFDSYIHRTQKRHLSIVTQRGASGIEGNISTVIGIADQLSPELPLAAVTGDIAAIHDLNALLELSKLKRSLALFVVNNGGGGIFNLLPIAREKNIMPLLTTPHSWQLAPIAQCLGLTCQQVSDRQELQAASERAFAMSSPCLIEILIDDLDNQNVYRQLRTIRL